MRRMYGLCRKNGSLLLSNWLTSTYIDTILNSPPYHSVKCAMELPSTCAKDTEASVSPELLLSENILKKSA